MKKKDSDLIHDRWILSKNICYNLPSSDIVARAQYSEIKQTDNIIPFDDRWDKSLDILKDWEEISKDIEKLLSDRKKNLFPI